MPRKEEEKGSGSESDFESFECVSACGWQVRKASSQGDGDRVRSEYAYIQQRYEQGNLNVSHPPFSLPIHVLVSFPRGLMSAWPELMSACPVSRFL